MNRDEISSILLGRGATTQRSTSVPVVGGEAITEFFERFESYSWPLGNSFLNGFDASEFSRMWNFPDSSRNETFANGYVPGRDVSGVRLLAVDEFSLLVDAGCPNGQLFVDGYDRERSGIARATGVTLWGWLERLAQLLIESPSSDLSFEDEIPGNGPFEDAIWFSEPSDVVAVLQHDEITLGLAGKGRFRRDLPMMADADWVAQTFGTCADWLQLKLIESLDLLWKDEPLKAQDYLSSIKQRQFNLNSDVNEALFALGA